MKEKKGKIFSKENRLYWYTALGSLAIVLSLIILVTSISLSSEKGDNVVAPPVNEEVNNTPPVQQEPDSDNQAGVDPDQSVVTEPDGFMMPVTVSAVLHDFGFYYNQTLNNYYEHEGLDFSAEVGTEVFAADDGVIESVYTADVLSGTEIVIDHGNGLKTVYRFVTAADGIVAGATVKRGDAIATVAEANGSEYKDGAHLHFEVLENDKNVDPVNYLTFEEK